MFVKIKNWQKDLLITATGLVISVPQLLVLNSGMNHCDYGNVNLASGISAVLVIASPFVTYYGFFRLLEKTRIAWLRFVLPLLPLIIFVFLWSAIAYDISVAKCGIVMPGSF